MQERAVETSEKASFKFWFETFEVFELCLEEIFSPSAASVVLQLASNKCGRHTCRQILKEIKTRKNVLTYLSYIKNELNWGKILFQNISVEKGCGEILVYNSFEAISRRGTKPVCHFMRGYLAGFLSELFEREIKVEEDQCGAMGHNCCKFSFR